MACIFPGKSLSQEYMPQMTTAVRTENFRAPPVRIRLANYGAFNLIVKARPAAVTVEFVLGPVKRGIAAPADIDPGLLVIHIFTGPWLFRTFMDQYILLKISKFIVLHGFFLLL
jgi:hypothetical protein